MPTHRTTASAKAHLSDRLLAYSTVAAASIAATSIATADPAPSYPPFTGTLPSIDLGSSYGNLSDSASFMVGGATFTMEGSKFHTSSPGTPGWSGSPGSPGSPDVWWKSGESFSFPVASYTHFEPGTSGFPGSPGTPGSPGFETFSGNFGLNVANGSFTATSGTGLAIASTYNGPGRRYFGGSGASSTGWLGFNTSGGGSGSLNFKVTFGGGGPQTFELLGGSFTSAIPEPASLAYGLGLVALGFAGVREHRRRRTAAASAAASKES